MSGLNEICITKTAGTILGLLGIEKPGGMAEGIGQVLEQWEAAFSGEKCDRIFMYNPDAVAMWIYEKYRDYFVDIDRNADIALPMLSVMPSVTPVCFASMYSGLMPKEHGIMKYEKPVLKVKTVFDVLAGAGKRTAIVSTKGDSISEIFLGRNVDYFIFPSKEECNEKALELIKKDEHDVIVLYNGDYDYYMHRFTPEGKRPLRVLRENIETFTCVCEAIGKNKTAHRTAAVFAPDHGCHKTCLFLGNHGSKKECDRNIMHFYRFI